MEKSELMIDIQSKYVGAASLFASTDEERDDVACVYVTPGHCGGAIIWSLDGHTAFFAHDEDGKAEKPIRISLHKDLLKTCGCKLDKMSNRLQAEPSLEYLRIVNLDKNGCEEWLDFNPAPARIATSAPDYRTFIEKFSQSRPGIGAKQISGHPYISMRKLFKGNEGLSRFCIKSKARKDPFFILLTMRPKS